MAQLTLSYAYAQRILDPTTDTRTSICTLLQTARKWNQPSTHQPMDSESRIHTDSTETDPTRLLKALYHSTPVKQASSQMQSRRDAGSRETEGELTSASGFT